MVQNYPNLYPSEFIIIDNTFECGRVYIEELDFSIKELAHYNIGFYFKLHIFALN